MLILFDNNTVIIWVFIFIRCKSMKKMREKGTGMFYQLVIL